MRGAIAWDVQAKGTLLAGQGEWQRRSGPDSEYHSRILPRFAPKLHNRKSALRNQYHCSGIPDAQRFSRESPRDLQRIPGVDRYRCIALKRRGKIGRGLFLNRMRFVKDKRYTKMITIPLLDLHDVKNKSLKVMSQLLQEARYTHIQKLIIVTTGRGLNNPQGDRGVLHRACQRKISKQLTQYVKGISSTNKQGALWVTLRKKHTKRGKNIRP